MAFMVGWKSKNRGARAFAAPLAALALGGCMGPNPEFSPTSGATERPTTSDDSTSSDTTGSTTTLTGPTTVDVTGTDTTEGSSSSESETETETGLETTAGISGVRRLITIENPADLPVSNFPVLIEIQDGEIDYDRWDPVGDTVYFTDFEGGLLFHEIDTYNHPDTGLTDIWVLLPQLNGAVENYENKLWMYYGDPEVPEPQPAATWSDLAPVYHFNEAASPDSSGAGIEAASATASVVPGGIGAAAHFQGNQNVEFMPTGMATSESGHIEFYFRPDLVPQDPMAPPQYLVQMLGHDEGDLNNDLVLEIELKYLFNLGPSVLLWVDGGGDQPIPYVLHAPVENPQPQSWHHVSVNWFDNGQITFALHVDGFPGVFLENNTGPAAPIVFDTDNWSVGALLNGTQGFYGDIDELRLSMTPRPPPWITASEDPFILLADLGDEEFL